MGVDGGRLRTGETFFTRTHQPGKVQAGAMYVTSRKSEFSVAFIHAVASVAGYTFIGSPRVDDSVDLTLGATRAHGGTRRAPHLDVQAKCTETDDGAGDLLAYPLPMKNYDDLRDEELHVPRILVVLCVPNDLDHWLHETVEQTALRRVAYWLSLRGQPAVDNDRSRTVHLPRAQRFTVAALKGIMTRIGEGGGP